MDIVVTVKHVPDPNIPPTHFTIDENANRVVAPAGIPPLMNGYDENALEEALRLREQHGGRVTVISLGDDSARETLKRAIAMGADAAILINDPALLDGDSFVTARTLAAAIKKVGSFDLVLCGRQASDTDAGQVLFGIAESLNIPVVSPAKRIEYSGDDALIVDQIAESGTRRVRVQLPALIGASSELNEPRYPPMRGVMAAGRAQIPAWNAAELEVEGTERKVALRRLYMDVRESRVELVEGETPADTGAKLAEKLKEVGLI